MKKIFPFIFCLFLLAACDKSKDFEEPVTPVQPELGETYNYQSIEYFLSEEDGMKIDSVSIISRAFSNESASTVTHIIDVPDQTETSQFISNENLPFTLGSNDSLKISVPVSISENKIVTGASIWKYSESDKQGLPASVSNQHVTVPVKPNTKVTTEIFAKWRKLSAHYIATYMGQKTGKTLKIEGKWKGLQLTGFSTYARFDNIK